MSEFEMFYNNKVKVHPTLIIPGGFKPPHQGHFEAICSLANSLNAKEIIIVIGPKERDGITQQQSEEIWNIYKGYIRIPTKLVISSSNPVTDMYKIIESDIMNYTVVGVGKKDKDNNRVAYMRKHPDKYPNTEIREMDLECGGISGSEIRKRIVERDPTVIDDIVPYYINNTDKDLIKYILSIK